MTAQTDPFNDFVRAVNAAASSIASFGRNVMIKVSGGYTDNEYADAMMREHRTALAKQPARKVQISYPFTAVLRPGESPQALAERIAREMSGGNR